MKKTTSTVIISVLVILLSTGLPFMINALSENDRIKALSESMKSLQVNYKTSESRQKDIKTPYFLPESTVEFQWVYESSQSEIPTDENKTCDDSSDDIFEPTELPLPSSEILTKIPYPDDIEDNDGSIQTMQYGIYNLPSYVNLKNGGQVRNCTSVSNDTLLELSSEVPDLKIELNSQEPQVLIYHSHATESYEPYARNFYDKDFSCKTTDITKNMIRIGEEIVSELNEAGIHTIHDKTIHDYPSYNNAYNSSRETVLKILEEYPSIKVVLDIHRDGIERNDGTRIAPVCEIDGNRVAQVMIISCCDDGGNIPLCNENFKLASFLQSQFESDYKGITRPILFDYRFYNQDLSIGSLLVEIGSHANSLSEAELSGKYVGKSISNALKKLAEPIN